HRRGCRCRRRRGGGRGRARPHHRGRRPGAAAARDRRLDVSAADTGGGRAADYDRPRMLLRPNIGVITLIVEAIWLVVAITAYQDAIGGRDAGLGTTVAIAATALIWAAPAIALIAVAWLIEQLLQLRDRSAAAPPPPPPPPPS